MCLNIQLVSHTSKIETQFYIYVLFRIITLLVLLIVRGSSKNEIKIQVFCIIFFQP